MRCPFKNCLKMTGKKLSLAQLDLKKESDHLAMTFLFLYIPLSFSQFSREIDYMYIYTHTHTHTHTQLKDF